MARRVTLATFALSVALSLAAAAALCCGLPGCTNGTTPVCDDAGTCLILPPSSSGGSGSSSGGGGSGSGGGGDAAKD
jgi:hypothetical protein